MKTFRESLLRQAFEGKWPLWSTPEEVREWFDNHPEPLQMKRAYELGLIHRDRGLTQEEIDELDSLSNEAEFYSRWESQASEEEDMREAWDRALGNVQ